MKIIQIAIGQIPEVLKPLMQSWADYAAEHGYIYEVVTEFPEKYNSLPCDDRRKSNWYRVDLCCEHPFVAVPDWDTEPNGIVFGDDPIFVHGMECCPYFGNRPEIAYRLRHEMGDMNQNYMQLGIIRSGYRNMFMKDYRESESSLPYERWLFEESRYKNWFKPEAVKHSYYTQKGIG